MMYDLDTLTLIKNQINKKLHEIKEHLIYSVDTTQELYYARAKINALETLLQDLKDLQRKEDDIYDNDEQT